ncbi:MAG: hypothetical protein ACXIVQ_12275 [Acidimicrobiales bacterium]
MALLQPPVWLENSDQHNAQDYRALLASLTGGGVAGATHFKVTETPATPDMSVRVGVGGIFIPSTRSTAQGTYHVYNDAPVTVVVPAADPTNARIDLVVVRIRDEAQDVSLSQNDAVVELIAGTPSATPAEPTISFEDYLVLARVNVAAGVSAIVSGNIVDRRTASRAWSAPRGEIAYSERTSNAGPVVTDTVIGGLGVTGVVVPSGRRLKITTELMLKNATDITATDLARVTIRRDATTIMLRDVLLRGAGGNQVTAHVEARIQPAAGTYAFQTSVAKVLTSGATEIIAASTFPAYILVEDIGGVLL